MRKLKYHEAELRNTASLHAIDDKADMVGRYVAMILPLLTLKQTRRADWLLITLAFIIG